MWGTGEGQVAIRHGRRVVHRRLRDVKPLLLAMMAMEALDALGPEQEQLRRKHSEAVVMLAKQYRECTARRGLLQKRKRPPPRR